MELNKTHFCWYVRKSTVFVLKTRISVSNSRHFSMCTLFFITFNDWLYALTKWKSGWNQANTSKINLYPLRNLADFCETASPAFLTLCKNDICTYRSAVTIWVAEFGMYVYMHACTQHTTDRKRICARAPAIVILWVWWCHNFRGHLSYFMFMLFAMEDSDVSCAMIITLTPYMVLPLFATRFADYAGGIRISFM